MSKIIKFIGVTIRFFFGKNSVNKIYFYKFLISVFFITFKLRLSSPKYLFWSIRHVGMLYLLLNLKQFLIKNKYDFFLFDGALLGSVRQGAIAGRGKDLDIAILIENKNQRKKLISLLKKNFIVKATGPDTCHIFLRNINLFADLIIFSNSKDGKKIFYFSKFYKKKIEYNKSYVFPLKLNNLYYQKCLVPNKSKKILKIIYGRNFLIPNKKNQLYLR